MDIINPILKMTKVRLRGTMTDHSHKAKSGGANQSLGVPDPKASGLFAPPSRGRTDPAKTNMLATGDCLS